MNDKEIDLIIKQSVLSPSDNFTDDLMEKINLKGQPKIGASWTLIMLCFACLLLFVLSMIISLPEISMWKYSISFPPIIIQIAIISFILYEINQIREIYQVIIKSGKNKVIRPGVQPVT